MPIAESEHLAIQCAKSSYSKNAINIKLFNVEGCSDVADFCLVCTGTSDRHVRGIADGIIEYIRKERGEYPSFIDGYSDGKWVILDYFYVVIHIFFDYYREDYMIEELWSDAIDIEWKNDK